MAQQVEWHAQERYEDAVRSSRDAMAPQTRDNHSIDQQYGQLAEGLQVLAKTVDTLAERLQPVLGPGRGMAERAEGPTPESPLSPLAESLRSEGKVVASITGRVQELISRLEC